jgi:multidrug efflux pump subunit AcrA (membrane-fusion protein)
VRQGGDLRERVMRAEAQVQAALRLWRAGDASGCDECCLSLQAAITELEGAQTDAAIPAASLRKRLERLQADVNRLTLLVDSATAFCRGMALTIGREGASPLDARSGIESVA